jgi:hypothetical protein
LVQVTGGSIYYLDGDLNNNYYSFFSNEYNPNQLYSKFISEDGQPDAFGFFNSEISFKSFYIQIPTAYQNDTTVKNKITALVEKIRPIGSSWGFKYY